MQSLLLTKWLGLGLVTLAAVVSLLLLLLLLFLILLFLHVDVRNENIWVDRQHLQRGNLHALLAFGHGLCRLLEQVQCASLRT